MNSYALSPDVHDIYEDGEQTAVYAGDSVLVLGPLASALVRWVRDGESDLDALSSRAVSRFGMPPSSNPAVLVADNLDELRKSGLLI